ncbi:MAG: hypothetical protein R6U32_05065 [Candidatus Woesearchaeota archaeon]
MKRTGLCMICEMKPAVHTCSMCGRVVCDEHFDLRTGLCTACARGKTAESVPKDILK